MTKVNGTTGLYFKLNRLNKKEYFLRYSSLENGATKSNTKKLSTSLTEAKRMIPLIKSGLTVVEARKKLAKQNISKSSKIMTFGRLYELYLPTISNQSMGEISTKKSRYNIHILPYKAKGDKEALASKDIQTLTYSYFQNMINDFDELNTNKAIRMDRKTQDNVKATIQGLFTFAHKEGLYNKFNPLTHVKIKAFDNHKELLLTDIEIKGLFTAIKNMPVDSLEDRKKRLFFLFMMHGRRKSETLKMEWSHLDFLNREYKIILDNSKSRKTQVLKMTDWLCTELLDLRSQIDMSDIDTYIFLNPTTQTYYKDFSKTFNSLKKQANIASRFTLHEFRHIVGTIAVRKLDKKLHEVGEALTHSNDEVTKIYVNRTSENSKSVIDDVLDFVGVVPKEETPKDDLETALKTVLEILQTKR